MKHLLALIGLTLLCAAWIKFQLWLKRVDPSKNNYQPGCGACQSSSCDRAGTSTENEIAETAIGLPLASHGGPSGEDECEEKRSPS